MRTKALALSLFAAFAVAAFAAPPTQFAANQPTALVQIKPQAMPTSSTVVAAKNAYLVGISFTNTTGAAITVTFLDGQGSPISLMATVSIAANSVSVLSTPFGYWCNGGFTVQASASGLNYYAVWKQ